MAARRTALRLRFLHWNASEASSTIDLLRTAGFQVDYDRDFDSAMLRQCREHPPAVFLIDLSRLPSRGREIAIAVRQSPKTRHIPIVFVSGAPEKIEQVKAVLPDATYCNGKSLVATLKTVRPPVMPLKPLDMMNRYGNRTAAQKLGLIVGSTLAMIDPPSNVSRVLGHLPDQVELVEGAGTVTICFVHTVDGLRADISRVRGLASKTRLWISWRKRGASSHAGITDNLVRETGIDLGLVDYKICSIDETWSAMLFAVKKLR